MNRHFCIIAIILSFTFGSAIAHQDFFTFTDFGNVKVRIKTGHEYEEIYKSYIIGQLAEKLAKELNYSDQIFLDFDHHYTSNCDPVYFISYDKGKIEYTSTEKHENDYLSTNAIVVRQISRSFDVITTLKLLEYSIKNISQIKNSQRTIEYEENYCQWIIKTIDTNLIRKQINKGNSDIIKKIENNKVARPGKKYDGGISYFWQSNKYHLFPFSKPDTILLSLDNIYDFNIDGFTFDTDSSFFFLSDSQPLFVSKRLVINNINDNYEPFKITNIGGAKFSIYFSYYSNEDGLQPKERTLIYLREKDELIQDLDKLLDKR
jgi:hypothetical protein